MDYKKKLGNLNIIVDIPGADAEKQARAEKAAYETVGINTTFRNLQKKYNKAAGKPSKLRDAIFEICEFLDKWTEEDLRDAKITVKIVEYMYEWKKILKPKQ